jgi:Hint domain
LAYSAYTATFDATNNTWTVSNANAAHLLATPANTTTADSTANTLGDVQNATFTVNRAVAGNPASQTWHYIGTMTVTEVVNSATINVVGFVGSYTDINNVVHTQFFTPGNLGATGTGVMTLAEVGDPTSTPLPGDWNLSGAGALACFLEGSRVATPGGQTPVEDLKQGDLVVTASGASASVRWVGRSTISQQFADPIRVRPVRIMAGALGENLPVRDLLVSPGHALLIDDILIHAGALVNGTSIMRDTATPMVFCYYHVELDKHDVLLAEGVPAESFLDGIEDMGFDNIAERTAPAAAVAEMALPRAKSSRQVPQATRDRLAARVRVLSLQFAAAA